jgi:hypothetical protein
MADDDELLAATTPVLHALHRGFSGTENRSADLLNGE